MYFTKCPSTQEIEKKKYLQKKSKENLESTICLQDNNIFHSITTCLLLNAHERNSKVYTNCHQIH